MKEKKYSKEEVTRIVNARLHRQHSRLTKDFEKRMKRCMASLHLMLYQEMCEVKKDETIEMQEPSLRDTVQKESDLVKKHPENPSKGSVKK